MLASPRSVSAAYSGITTEKLRATVLTIPSTVMARKTDGVRCTYRRPSASWSTTARAECGTGKRMPGWSSTSRIKKRAASTAR